jgi:hypothetical protein
MLCLLGRTRSPGWTMSSGPRANAQRRASLVYQVFVPRVQRTLSPARRVSRRTQELQMVQGIVLRADRHPRSPTRLRRDSCPKTDTHSCRVGCPANAAEQNSPRVLHRTRYHYRVRFCSARARDFLHGCSSGALAPLIIAQSGGSPRVFKRYPLLIRECHTVNGPNSR